MESSRKIEEDEIDLIALLETLWKGRKTVFKFVLIFGIIGLFIAIFSPKEYTATTIMIPSASKEGGGNLGGLAAIAGINLGTVGSSEMISPELYPKIIKSLPFKQELAETRIKVSGSADLITLREYFSDVYNPGLFAYIKKYTIGLPGLILGIFRGKQNERDKSAGDNLVYISTEQQQLYENIEGRVAIDVNSKEGYIVLSASMPEAVAAAQLTIKAQELLQDYIIDFKSRKAIEKLNFIEDRYKEKEEEFRKAELNLARFQDQNKNVISAQAATKEKRLQADYSLAYGVYSELAKQIEQQKIQVKEDTPVFSIIEPVSVPNKTSKPKRMLILAIWIFLGIVVGIGMVFGREFVRGYKKSRI